MASTSDSTVLSNVTRFRPRSLLAESRSPSRSPIHRAQFTTQELDPLLSNLSPESTLRALQATETISGGQRVPDALSKSIAGASAFERELGVRAALAAQKIREWLQEAKGWQWPGEKACALGLGFSTHEVPHTSPSRDDPFIGSLKSSQIHEYEERISDIQGGLDALEIDEVKDYVLEAHVSSRSKIQPRAEGMTEKRLSYGRMRDFTALITATIIRALPDLAQLNMLLIVWKARLTVLQLVPQFLQHLQSTHGAIQSAMASVRDEKSVAELSQSKLDKTKTALAEKVSSIGAQVDRMLDLLEGHDDRLPQGWIDTLENIELDFATWAVEAQRRVQHNEWVAHFNKDPNSVNAQIQQQPLKEDESVEAAIEEPDCSPPQNLMQRNAETQEVQQLPAFASSQSPTRVDGPSASKQISSNRSIDLSSVTPVIIQANQRTGDDLDRTPIAPERDKYVALPVVRPISPRNSVPRKPPLALDLPKSGHRRDISEISIADSAYSAFSDISNAEIINATAAEVVASPKVNVVENPFRISRDDLSSFTSPNLSQARDGKSSLSPSDSGHDSHVSDDHYFMRTPLIQRASTASMELIGKSQIRKVTLSRSISQDLISLVAKSEESTPSKALKRLTGEDSAEKGSPTEKKSSAAPAALESSPATIHGYGILDDDFSPISFQSRVSDLDNLKSQSLPRSSSRRMKQELNSPMGPVSSDNEKSSLQVDSEIDRKRKPASGEEKALASSAKSKVTEGTLESKIQNILTTLPTSIRLATVSDSANPSQASTASSSRSTTPAPGLVLSPAKKDKSSRRSTGADSEVKVYHLTRPGQPRDAPPTKLYVRLVGEGGERVMVRVGGGWADLGEYLREYSLHHGRRSTVDGRLEVANFPATGQSPKEVVAGTPPMGPGSISKAPTGINARRLKSRSPSNSDTTFDFASLPDIDVAKARRGTTPAGRGRSPETATWTPPPVPPIPISYTMHSPTTISNTYSGGPSSRISTAIIPAESPTLAHFNTTTVEPYGSSTDSSAISTPGVSTTTTVYSPMISTQKYTPLGAAGPKSSSKSNNRRATTFGVTSTPENEAWVEGIVGKARAVSGTALSPVTTTSTSISTSHGPMTTTTTTTLSTPVSRRVSEVPIDSPGSSQGTPSPGVPGGRSNSLGSQRSKSRMSLGDVSGIKRVFLRKKAEK